MAKLKTHGAKGPYPFKKPPGSASCIGDALALVPRLRRLELLGVPLSAVGRPSLETLVLQLPTLQDLQATGLDVPKEYQGDTYGGFHKRGIPKNGSF